MRLSRLHKAALLSLLPKMAKIDAVQCQIKFREEFGEDIDWHEFGYYLDELRAKGLLVISKPGGFVQYKLAKGES